MNRLRLSTAKSISAGLFGLILINLVLVAFVTVLDRMLGQAPQLTVPLFALLIASVAFIATRKRRIHESDLYEEIKREGKRPKLSHRRSSAPAFISMTIIRRQSVMRQTSENERFEEVIQ